MPDNKPHLYTDLASWWPLMSAPEDYVEEAAIYASLLSEHATRPLQSVLELGSGGGNNASHMKQHFAMTLVDVAAGMVEVSRKLNPECEHHVGDMRTVRLGREFDAVFVHDAICYMATEADLRSVFETAYLHCAQGGIALFAPDHVRENFADHTDHGGHDGDGRSMRYLEWVHDSDGIGTTYEVDYAYVLREDGQPARVVHDHHVEGLFSREDWLSWIADAGFEPQEAPFIHSEVDYEGVMFLGVKR
ncbi:MAG: class I SAM-dependent methyltransferase [Chloroflexota bacterium]